MGLTQLRRNICHKSSVPAGRMRIARRFNAGFDAIRRRVPKGRLRQVPKIQPSLRDWWTTKSYPALKRRAILKYPSGTIWRLNLIANSGVGTKLRLSRAGLMRDEGSGMGSSCLTFPGRNLTPETQQKNVANMIVVHYIGTKDQRLPPRPTVRNGPKRVRPLPSHRSHIRPSHQ